MWNHEKFNFSTTSKFMGTVSAFVRQHAHGNGFCSDGYLWTREHQGIASECRIGSSENVEATLQLSQTDVSPYVVIDPFNSFTFCRPIVNADRTFVTMAKGSAVPLLASVLQYVKQYDLKPTVLQDGGQALIESSLKSLKAPQHDSNPNIEEIYQGRRDHFPMIRDTDRKVVKNTTHFIGSQIGYLYGLYANTKRQLVFSRQARDEPVTLLRKETMVFQDTDVDHLIRGLFAQTARGVGGVSVQDLAATLRYNGREKNESAPVVAAASAAAPASLPPTDATTV